MKRSAWLAAAVLVPRLLAYAFTENFSGDAVARTWLAYLWAQSPHVIGSFDQGGFQFGPLHLYLIGPLTQVLSLDHAGRLVSLVMGSATAVPLFALTRRLFGVSAATVTTSAFGVWGLHVQCSTTAAAEAPNLLLVVTALWAVQLWLDTGLRAGLWGAALLLNLSCATRYDSWLLVPLLSLLVAWRSRSVRAGVELAVLSSAFAAAWCLGNWADRGSPLYPLEVIDAFHRGWFPSEAAIWGPARYRVMTLLFWPGTVLVTLAPVLGFGALAGCVIAWRARPDVRWLLLLIAVPTAMYTLRSAGFGTFAPLARFTVKEVALTLVFLGPAFDTLTRRLPPLRRWGPGFAIGSTAAFSLWLGVFTYDTSGAWQNTVRAISPVTTNVVEVRQLDAALRASPSDGVLVVDLDPKGFDDLQLSFYSGYPFERVARVRSPLFEQRLSGGTPLWLVRFEGGTFESLLEPSTGALMFRGVRFEEVRAFGRMHLYRRA